MSFESLGLSEALLLAIAEKGYSTPSPIQAKAIPAILSGRDVLAAAQTGTGKTAGFTLPLLQKLSEQAPVAGKRPIRALIMTPTRELAAQVLQSVKDYGAHLKLRSTVVFGGVNINPQISQLRGGVDILVATPGRLLDLHNQKAFSLSSIQVLILDEADRMLDMGFINDIRKIIKLVPPRRQTLMFSATFSKEIRELTAQLQNDPISIEVAPRNTTADKVIQQVYRVDKGSKPELLKHLIETGSWEQVLVFTRTKHGADKLSQKLDKYGISATAIHGNKSQNARTRALAEFKAGKMRVLVATDIAARGLDIKQLPHVINYELPNIPEDYVHRIGRTGRAGAEGHAISLVDHEEAAFLKRIELLLGQKIELCPTPGFIQRTTTPQQDSQPRPRTQHNAPRTQRVKPAGEGARPPRENAGREGARPPRENAGRPDQNRAHQPRRPRAAPRPKNPVQG